MATHNTTFFQCEAIPLCNRESEYFPSKIGTYHNNILDLYPFTLYYEYIGFIVFLLLK